MSIVERDRLAIRKVAGLMLFTHRDVRLARCGDPRMYKHTARLILKLLKREYAVRLAPDTYRITELGKYWCGADSVTNT